MFIIKGHPNSCIGASDVFLIWNIIFRSGIAMGSITMNLALYLSVLSPSKLLTCIHYTIRALFYTFFPDQFMFFHFNWLNTAAQRGPLRK